MRSRFGKLVIAVLGILTLLLASCSGASTGPAASGTPSASSGTPSASATQGTTVTKPQGTLKIGADFIGGGILDPQFASPGAFANLSLPAIYDPMLTLSADGSIQPGALERWEIAPDGMSHTFYVRKGIKFHDGTDLTAADVKFSLDRFMAPEATIPSQSPYWRAQIAGVNVKDDYTVVVNLKKPSYLLLDYIHVYSAVVMPKKYIEEKGPENFKKNPIGSGPWKVVRYEPGARLELEATESHWRAKPQFKNIIITHVNEEATKVAMLKTGEIDLAQVAIDSAAGLKSSGLSTNSYDSGTQAVGTLWFDPKSTEKFGDIRVRKAVQYSVNNQEMIDSLISGNGTKIYLAAVSPKAWFFNPDIKVDAYDPEGAKKLLADAGFPNGFNIKMWNHGGFQGTLTLAVGGYLKKIGINAESTPIETGAYYALYQPTPKPDIFNTIRIGTSTGEDLGWDRMVIYYHSTRSSFKNNQSPRLDELIDQVPTIADTAQRTKMGKEATKLAYEQYTALRLFSFNTVVAYSSKVVGQISSWKTPFGLSGFQLETITRTK